MEPTNPTHTIADDFDGNAAELMRTLDPSPAGNLATFLTRWQQDAVMIAQLLRGEGAALTDAMDAMDAVRVLVVGIAFGAIVESNGAGVITVAPEDPADLPTTPVTDITGTLLDAALADDAPTAPKLLPAGYVDEDDAAEAPTVETETTDPGADMVTGPVAPMPGRDHPIDQTPPGV